MSALHQRINIPSTKHLDIINTLNIPNKSLKYLIRKPRENYMKVFIYVHSSEIILILIN